MNKQLKKRLICWGIPLAVGGLAALLSGGGMGFYRQINQPPLSPPGWIFPIVWTILYLLMGEASYRVLTSGAEPQEIKKALTAYGVQLFLNFLWPLFFFGGQMYLTALIILILLWVAIVITMRRFSRIDETAGDLIIPYVLWVTFAGYLNFGVFLLN
ncbi:MAG: tryptophan-rich sensory protein [Oscillospiraceae bacterium]|nr:tryptophan-rich sensory protein [Oscillospiraceae bacterium]